MFNHATKHSANQVWVNSLTWYAITTPELPGLGVWSQPCHQVEQNLEKTPLHYVGKLLLEAVEEQLLSEHLIWATDQHQKAHMPAIGMLQKVTVVQAPSGWAPIVENAGHIGTCKQKVNTITPTYETGGRLNSKNRKLTWGGPTA